jgi:cobalt-zinc-cadmium efflux system protein
VNVLLEGTPPHVDLVAVERATREVPGVRRVHDLHIWTLTSGKDAMSGHVVVADVAEADRLTAALHDLLHERFGIAHTTIQVESERLVQVTLPGDGRPRPE